MDFLVVETDYDELPTEPQHRWLALEKIIRSRLIKRMEAVSSNEAEVLQLHYMDLVADAAKNFEVASVKMDSGSSVNDVFQKFLRTVTVAQSRIWATSSATYPFGRVALDSSTKEAILTLLSEVELCIESWNISAERKKTLRKCLEDFRREIKEPKTRIGYALSELAKVAAVAGVFVATTTSTVADAPVAIANIQWLLGAAQLELSSPEVKLVESEKRLLLPAPVRQITDQSDLDREK